MFKDHFSGLAERYARHRPDYPPTLFSELAALAPARRQAWDCATGTGQAARGLAGHFSTVLATDGSAAQLARARAPANVTFHQAAAESCPLASGVADLVTVAQALHWLDLPAFYAEVRRVLAPGAVLAVWSYPLLRVAAAIDGVIDRFYHDVLGLYWPPERRHVETGYAQLEFPFAEISVGHHQMSVCWSLSELSGYLQTWSALRVYREQTGQDPWPAIAAELDAAWGPAAARRSVRWPLRLRVGRRD